MAEIHRHRGASQVGEVEITARIEALQRKLNKLNSMETDLVGLKLRGQVSQEVFEQQGALLKAERVHYQEETARQEQALQGHRERNEALGLSTGVDAIDTCIAKGSRGNAQRYRVVVRAVDVNSQRQAFKDEPFVLLAS